MQIAAKLLTMLTMMIRFKCRTGMRAGLDMATQVQRVEAWQADGTVVAFPCQTAAALGQVSRRTDVHSLTDEERDELNRLRWMVMKSRLAPKPDLERACFLLAGEPEASLDRFAVAFFRGLECHARRRMNFYRPGAETVSDDESWLLRLLAAWRSNDEVGAGALIGWRVKSEGRRWMRFLSAGLVRGLGS
ncbi:hypothetical protein [Consotaella aegiceratis]|uniref:hypothetical protein n=1 Tax=Consotaella aegiceratis TaxID=3097961 RepID=UPI002F42CAAC